MNWLISSSRNTSPARLANVFDDGVDHVDAAGDRLGAEAVADAGDEEQHGDDEDQAVHQR
jgi:hypothetical protein